MLNSNRVLKLDQAKHLVKTTDDINLLNYDHWENGCSGVLAEHNGWINIGLLEISDDDAIILSRFIGKGIRLDKLRTISENTATSFLRLNERLLSINFLAFNEIKSHVSLATMISKNTNWLHLEYLDSISSGLASAVVKAKYLLRLGLKELDRKIAEILVKTSADLILKEISSIDNETAKVLARHRGNGLTIGLVNPNEKVMKELSRYRGENLDIGKSNSNKIDRELIVLENSQESYENKFDGNNFTTADNQYQNFISDAGLLAISDFCGKSLFLYGISVITVKNAKIFSRFNCDNLHILNVTRLDPGVDPYLLKYKGRLVISFNSNSTNIRFSKELWDKINESK